jgi:hypothetical protein
VPLAPPTSRGDFGAEYAILGNAGVIAPSSNLWAANALTLTANRAQLARFVVPRAYTVSSIAYYVITAATLDDPVDVGIYTVSGATYVRLASSGATSGKLNGAVGRKSIALTATLAPLTIYYAAIAGGPVGGVAATIGGSFYNFDSNLLFGSVPGTIDGDWKNSTYPLPATISSPGGDIDIGPMLAVVGT